MQQQLSQEEIHLKLVLQAFWYSLRTGILPIVFLFNHELLLIGIENIWHGLTCNYNFTSWNTWFLPQQHKVGL